MGGAIERVRIHDDDHVIVGIVGHLVVAAAVVRRRSRAVARRDCGADGLDDRERLQVYDLYLDAIEDSPLPPGPNAAGPLKR